MSKAIGDNYEVHLCSESELPQLKEFLHVHWKKDHALAVSSELMDWQHHDSDNKVYNFFIVKDTVTDEICSILGFIPTSHYDSELAYCENIWLAIWKVRDVNRSSGLGMVLFSSLVELKKPVSITAIGLSEMIVGVYKHLGFTVGQLNQYYMVNESKTDFNLIGNFDRRYVLAPTDITSRKKLIKYDKTDFARLEKTFNYTQPAKQLPRKSLKYLFNRYVLHPIYEYDVYGIVENTRTEAIIVIRKVSYEQNYALRIVDYYGPAESLIGMQTEFQNLLNSHNAEYIDFYNLGIDEELMHNAGFLKRHHESSVIVPNYYEPFIKKNVEIECACRDNSNSDHFFFKGDSDQDRPNLIC